MAKVTNLTPKMSLRSAEQELMTQPVSGELPFGASQGGLQMYSNSFKRGYGDDVFGSDENGIWLGAADYNEAPFKVGMDGQINITSDDGTNSSLFTAQGLILYKNGIPQVVIATI
jgi:hypothetical protein